MEDVKEYYLGIDNNFEYFIEETNYDELLGWNNFYIIKRNYKKDDFDSYSKEKFNFNAKSDNGFTLKSLIQLHNDNLSREDRFSLVEIGRSIEKLISVSEMCKLGCSDIYYFDNFQEEKNVLKDKNLEEKINEKILQLWDVAVKILERGS